MSIFRNAVFRLFQSNHTFLIRNMTTVLVPKTDQEWETLTDGYHKKQVLYLEETCIEVNVHDKPLGPCSKKVCHLMENIEKGLLHRAFSVFLFNSKNELLMQKRSPHKITFPEHWTNTCCSHPLHFDAEMVSHNALGAKRAAQRKLNHELGIPASQLPLDCFHFLTRIHYMASNVPEDGVWGEHEIDYILFIQKDVDINPNEEEVRDWGYFSPEQIKDMINKSTFNPLSKDGLLVSPWFKIIYDGFLDTWWSNLNSLEKVTDTETIHRLC